MNTPKSQIKEFLIYCFVALVLLLIFVLAFFKEGLKVAALIKYVFGGSYDETID